MYVRYTVRERHFPVFYKVFLVVATLAALLALYIMIAK